MSRRYSRTILHTALFLLTVHPAAFAQAPPADPALTSADLFVKIIGGTMTGIITLVGLPIVLLTYKKTRAEIRKLELEARNLEAQSAGSTTSAPAVGGMQIVVNDSPNVNVKVLADPRFLAPLLLLVDFIFAWIVLAIAGYLLDFFALELVRPFFLAPLAAILLVPIAKQVLKVRALLRPPRSAEELRQAISQARVAVYAACILLAAAPLFSGTLMLLIGHSLDGVLYVIAWTLIVIGIALGISFAVLRNRIDSYLTSQVNAPIQ